VCHIIPAVVSKNTHGKAKGAPSSGQMYPESWPNPSLPVRCIETICYMLSVVNIHRHLKLSHAVGQEN